MGPLYLVLRFEFAQVASYRRPRQDLRSSSSYLVRGFRERRSIRRPARRRTRIEAARERYHRDAGTVLRPGGARELQDVLDAIGENVDIYAVSHATVGAILDETHRRTEPKSLSNHPSC